MIHDVNLVHDVNSYGDYCMTELANDQKYTTAMFHTSKKYFNPDFIDVSKITRLELLYDNNGFVTCRVVIKEPSNTVSISITLHCVK